MPSFLTLLTLFLTLGCAATKQDSDKDPSESGFENVSGSGTKCESITRKVRKDPAETTGLFVFTVDSSVVDPCSVAGYIVGYPGQLVVSIDNAGNYFIEKVPTGDQDLIITGKGLSNKASLKSTSMGTRKSKVKFLAGVLNKADTIELSISGGISGVVTLAGQNDHAGIDVYIPGTGYTAKTDEKGAFALHDIPVGTHNLYFEKDGYHRGQVENVTVSEKAITTIDPIRLVLSTGAEGFVIINDKAAISISPIVSLTIGATKEAVLMKISENETFENSSWKPLVTSQNYDFKTFGDKKLFIKFADSNGLESSPFSASIKIEKGTLSLNSGDQATNDSLLRVSYSFSDNSTAKEMQISLSSSFEGANWVEFATESFFDIGELEREVSLYMRARDSAGRESLPSEATITLDVTPPPNLINFTGSTGPTLGEISLNFDFPDDTSDFHRVDIMKVAGSVAPADCSGTRYDRLAVIQDTPNWAMIAPIPGQYYSFRLCSYDLAGNLNSSSIAENIRARP